MPSEPSASHEITRVSELVHVLERPLGALPSVVDEAVPGVAGQVLDVHDLFVHRLRMRL